MYIRNYTSSLIFFAYWDRRHLPAVGREDVPIASGEDPPRRGKPKHPNINLLPIIFLSFLPTGKVADNQIILNFVCVNFVIFGVCSYKSYPRKLVLKIKFYNRSVIAAFNVKDNPIIFQNACV